jgi:hypothetical protein
MKRYYDDWQAMEKIKNKKNTSATLHMPGQEALVRRRLVVSAVGPYKGRLARERHRSPSLHRTNFVPL